MNIIRSKGKPGTPGHPIREVTLSEGEAQFVMAVLGAFTKHGIENHLAGSGIPIENRRSIQENLYLNLVDIKPTLKTSADLLALLT